MKCKELNNLIISYIEKELTSEKESEFKKHLSECSECSKLFSEVEADYLTLDNAEEIEPRAFFAESIMNKLESEEEKVSDSIFDVTFDIAFSKFFKKFAYSGVAFIIVLIIFLYSTGNLFLINNSSDEDDFNTGSVSTEFFDNF